MAARTSRIAAIALDAPNEDLLAGWMRDGRLPNLQRLFAEGVHRRLEHTKYYRNETCWSTFASGRVTDRTGFSFSPQTYEFRYSSTEEEPAEAFYSLGDGYEVCTFDLPLPIASGVRGAQVIGWGSELSASVARSTPPELISEIEQRFGQDPKLEGIAPVLDKRTNRTYQSFPLPSIYDDAALARLTRQLRRSATVRADICNWLLSRRDWDLFLACFPEAHTANHLLWHLGQQHPIAPAASGTGESPMFEVTRAIDESIGRVRQHLAADQTLAVFTMDHTAHNVMDLPSMALLPEVLFRWCFRGKSALAGDDGAALEPPLRHFRSHWKHEVWKSVTAPGRAELVGPAELDALGDPLAWNPASWYRRCWPRMRAFALPGVSDGYVRVNVRGRESQGIVEPSSFAATLDELAALLAGLRNPRTGDVLVKEIIRTRNSPGENPDLPPDLIVCWQGDASADAVDVPGLGRIGPLPFFRTGGHMAHGSTIVNFVVAAGPAAHRLDEAPPGPLQLEQLPSLLSSMMR